MPQDIRDAIIIYTHLWNPHAGLFLNIEVQVSGLLINFVV